MDIREHNKNLDILEQIIDKEGLAGILEIIAEVSSSKADHLRENWQDEQSAEVWDNYAQSLLQFVHKNFK